MVCPILPISTDFLMMISFEIPILLSKHPKIFYQWFTK